MKVCIFCASSAKVAPVFFEAAETVARVVAAAGHTIIYGGGAVGLMGALADAALACHTKIIGVLPRFMRQVEWQHNGLTELILVDTMHQRKALMIAGVDAVVALPGGTGTLEELMEVITLKRLGKFTKPVVIVNTNGFYDALLTLFDKMADKYFIRPEHRDAWTVIEQAADVLTAIERAKPWNNEAIHFAAV
ncbi:MAG: TIGR00730 family Rossman fold protein [Prevotellaceae bacterium]|jgi:uncharacterized protein (TIGR00730 family)|nr:TIGR00730 family Rossman fold protein [Prevotellaceae bacterium]